MSPNPSLVFVPGAWHRAETYEKAISELRPRGFQCVAVTLPSTTGDITLGFGEDVKAVQDAIRAETAEGNDVVIVSHSYGGHVGSSAIRGLARASHDGSPSANGDASTGHVIGLAMMATGFSITGLSFLELVGGKPPPLWVADTEAGIARLVSDARDAFYHDLPEDEGKLWVEKLQPHSLRSLTEGGEFAYAGWKDVPSWYLVTLEDHCITAEMQRMAVGMARGEGADVTEREVTASHSPMLSQPKATADFIADAAADFVKKSQS